MVRNLYYISCCSFNHSLNALIREVKLHKMYVNDHCLEDDTLGDVAIDTMKIVENWKVENLIQQCNCASCVQNSQGRRLRVCKVCQVVGLNPLPCCVPKWHKHLQKR